MGDDLDWARPECDDQAWSELEAPKGWGEQGFEGLAGFAWYRKSVNVTATAPRSPYLLVGRMLNAYVVYVNGHEVGHSGRLTPTPHAGNGIPQVFPVPLAAIDPSGPLTIAVRIWRDPRFAAAYPLAGGLQEGPFWFGDREVLSHLWWTELEKERSLFGGFVFHPGDDPKWRAPDWDDSQWAPIDPGRGWMRDGFPDHLGFGWYRTRIHMPLPQETRYAHRLPKRLGLRLPSIVGSYQVFASGERVAQFGAFPPHDHVMPAISQQCHIPDHAVSADGELVLAIRVFRSQAADIAFPGLAGLVGTPGFGQWETIELLSHNRSGRVQSTAFWGFSIAIILVGFYHLVLARWRRKQREYLWFGLFSLNMGTVFLLFLLLETGRVWINAIIALVVPLQLLLAVFYLKFTEHFFDLNQGRWLKLFLVLFAFAAANHWWAMYRLHPPDNLISIIIGTATFLFVAVSIFKKAFFSPDRFREAKIVAFGNLAFCVSIFYWLGLAAGVLWQPPFQHGMVVLLGTLVLLSAMAYSLAARFSRVHAELDEANRDLEDRVAQRTRELTQANELLTTKEATLRHEMSMAQKAQTFMLSRRLPEVPGLDLAAFSIPAKDVGGDYYDFFLLDSGHLGFAIGDVSGKGLSAALYMTLTKGLVQAHLGHAHQPAALLAEVNSDFLQAAPKNTFMSLLFGLVDPDLKRITLASAGHHPPIVIDSGQTEPSPLTCSGMALGLAPDAPFADVLEERTVDLSPGTWFALYSDGITEARNSQGEEFGLSRFVATLLEVRNGNANDMARALRSRLEAFTQGQAAHDDMTLVILKRQA